MALELVPLFALGIMSLLFTWRVLLIRTHQREQHLPVSPSALPIIGHFHLLRPLLHRSFQALSFRFGPIFSLRLGSVPCIVVTSPELSKEFLKTHELSFVSHARSAAIERITYDSSLAFSPYGPYWKFIKKVTVNELLNSRSINKFRSIREDEYSRLLKLVAERAKSCETVNLSEELPRLCHNVIGQMMLGKYSTAASSNTERSEKARLVIREATRIFGELNLCDFNKLWKKLDLQRFGKRIEDTHVKFDELVEKVLQEHEELRIKKNKSSGGEEEEEEEEEVKDFLSILLDILEDGKRESVDVGFSRVHIKALITDLFTAGTDTTAIAVEWALSELINHPKVLKKAREEIDGVVGNGRIVEESDVLNLPYIQAIIKETFRLHPPVPMVARIAVEDCKVGEYIIPSNTLLFVNNWAMGRDPKNWENPLDFWPERFLKHNKTSEMDVRGQYFQFLPFGSGRRICPGINLTMNMVPSLVAALIQCFEWKITKSKKMNSDDILEMDEKPGLTTPRAHDLVCFPVARSLSSMHLIFLNHDNAGRPPMLE